MKRVHGMFLVLGGTLFLTLGTGLTEFSYLFVFSALVLAGSFVWAYVNLAGVRIVVKRTYGNLRVGESLESRIVISNSSPLPKFGIEVSDLLELPGHSSGAIVNLPPFGEIPLVLNIPLRKRGIYRVGAPIVSSRDPFGIFQRRRRAYGTGELTVLPYMVEIPPFSQAQGDITGEGSLQRSAPDSTTSVSTVREHQPGESAKYIHWPATARKTRLMLKQFDGGVEDVAWVLLDLQQGTRAGDEVENTEEYAIAAAASVAKSYSEMGWAVGLMAYGDRQYILPPQEGTYPLGRIFVTLTEARAEGSVALEDLLTYWHSHLPSPTVSLVVVTSSVRPGWDVVLEASRRQGVLATVVLIDPLSFGGTGDPGVVLSQLQRRGVPTYLLRKGEDMSQALQHPWRFSDTHSERERVGV